MASGVLKPGRYSAAIASAQMQQPLLAKDDDSESTFDSCDRDESGEPESKLGGKNMLQTVAATVLATGGLAAAASAMIAVPTAAVLVMGGICAVNAPTVAGKHFQISKGEGVRKSVNNIRKEIHTLRDEIDWLMNSVDDLQTEADMLVGIEQELRSIVSNQESNVEQIVDLVKENEEILGKMRDNLRQTFVGSMVQIILRSDTDGDMKIDERELPLLSLRLQIQLEPFGIKLDTNAFKTMMEEDNDISNVLKFCGELLFQGERDDDNDDDDKSDESSDGTFDFENFCMNLDDGPQKMTFKEKLEIVTVDTRVCKGSVEAARGNRITLACPKKGKENTKRRSILKEVKRRQTVKLTPKADAASKKGKGRLIRSMMAEL